LNWDKIILSIALYPNENSVRIYWKCSVPNTNTVAMYPAENTFRIGWGGWTWLS